MIFHDRRMIGPSSALKEHLSVREAFKDILSVFYLDEIPTGVPGVSHEVSCDDS